MATVGQNELQFPHTTHLLRSRTHFCTRVRPSKAAEEIQMQSAGHEKMHNRQKIHLKFEFDESAITWDFFETAEFGKISATTSEA